MGDHLSLLAAATEVIHPSAHDWIVSLWFHDGSFVKRRVSPAKISEALAVERAIHSTSRRAVDVKDVEVRRFSDVAIVTATSDEEVRSLIERARTQNDRNR